MFIMRRVFACPVNAILDKKNIMKYIECGECFKECINKAVKQIEQ